MKITPGAVEATWRYIAALCPFLTLPDVDRVKIVCHRKRGILGEWVVHYHTDGHETYVLNINYYDTETLDNLLRLVAHEAIHAHQTMTGTDTKGQHNAAFHATWRRVARMFLWDGRRLV